ncbi:MAG: gamma carbonic anhydrase family protein [Erysipelotrichaceae bacterium]
MIIDYNHYKSKIAKHTWIAKDADIIGNVEIHENVSIFFHSVLRGDNGLIVIGEGSNIQDNCTLHCDQNYPLNIGKSVSVGHNAVLHGCIIEDEVLIGMGAIVMNGARIGNHSIVAAGCLISENTIIPENSIVMGIPGKVVKQVSEQQINSIVQTAKEYQTRGKIYEENGYGSK